MIIIKICKLLLPIFILNWIVSEADILVPGTRDTVISLFESVQIPTHDQWPESVRQMDVKEISEDLKNVIAKYQDGNVSNDFGQKARLSYQKLDEKLSKTNTSDFFDRNDMFTSLKNHQAFADQIKR